MRINIFILIMVLLLADYVWARQAGWVPLPSSPDLKIEKSGRAQKRKTLQTKKPRQVLSEEGATVYERQPPITEAEIKSFVHLLPKFRAWARQQGEEAHPVISERGEPDFIYTPKASAWVQKHNFNSRRFFCIMGRLAAGMMIVEEGNDFKGVRPRDMPEISAEELELVRRHMGELLDAGKNVPPVKVN